MKSKGLIKFYSITSLLLLLHTNSAFSLQPLPIRRDCYTIVWKHNHYELRLRDAIQPHIRKLDEHAVNKLLSLMKRTPVEKWTIPKYKAKWLKENAELALKEYITDNRLKNVLPEQRALFIRSFQDYWKTSHNNIRFYPDRLNGCQFSSGLSINIIEKDFNEHMITARNLYPIAVPWIVSMNDNEVRHKTYCTELTKCILKLLNMQYILDVSETEHILRRVIATNLMQHEILYKWNLATCSNLTGSAFPLLNKRFKIVSLSRIYGRLAIRLSPRELPKNILFNASFPLEAQSGKAVSLVVSLVKHLECIKANVQFTQLIRENPHYDFLVDYSDGSTFPANYFKQFETDYLYSNDSPLKPAMASLFYGSTMITVKKLAPIEQVKSRWLLFPSKKTYLWFFRGSTLFKWPSNYFKVTNKSDRHLVMRFKDITSIGKNKSSWFGFK